MKPTTYQTTIENILLWKSLSEGPFTKEFKNFKSFEDLAPLERPGIELSAKSVITDCLYASSTNSQGHKCELHVLFHDKEPFLIYQQLHDGTVGEEKILHAEVYDFFISLVVESYYEAISKAELPTALTNTYNIHIFKDKISPAELLQQLDESTTPFSIVPTIDIDTIVCDAIDTCYDKKYSIADTEKHLREIVEKNGFQLDDRSKEEDEFKFIVKDHMYTLVFKEGSIASQYRFLAALNA